MKLVRVVVGALVVASSVFAVPGAASYAQDGCQSTQVTWSYTSQPTSSDQFISLAGSAQDVLGPKQTVNWQARAPWYPTRITVIGSAATQVIHLPAADGFAYAAARNGTLSRTISQAVFDMTTCVGTTPLTGRLKILGTPTAGGRFDVRGRLTSAGQPVQACVYVERASSRKHAVSADELCSDASGTFLLRRSLAPCAGTYWLRIREPKRPDFAAFKGSWVPLRVAPSGRTCHGI